MEFELNGDYVLAIKLTYTESEEDRQYTKDITDLMRGQAIAFAQCPTPEWNNKRYSREIEYQEEQKIAHE